MEKQEQPKPWYPFGKHDDPNHLWSCGKCGLPWGTREAALKCDHAHHCCICGKSHATDAKCKP